PVLARRRVHRLRDHGRDRRRPGIRPSPAPLPERRGGGSAASVAQKTWSGTPPTPTPSYGPPSETVPTHGAPNGGLPLPTLNRRLSSSRLAAVCASAAPLTAANHPTTRPAGLTHSK